MIALLGPLATHLGRYDAGKLPRGLHEEVDVHARVVGGPQLRVGEQEVEARRLEGGQHEGRVRVRRGMVGVICWGNSMDTVNMAKNSPIEGA